MTFGEKLQKLRKSKNITQETLAQALFVSRTAVSKWESDRGYPNIDSLKQIAQYFGITVDALLSGDELLTLAEEDSKRTKARQRDLILGLWDASALILLFLPLFGQRTGTAIVNVSLLTLESISGYLRYAYLGSVISIALYGVFILALQNWQNSLWLRYKGVVSLFLGVIATALFIISQQPYASIYMFVFLLMKAFFLIKKQ